MARLFPGRYTAEAGDEFVVVLVGMRINRPWRIREWIWMSRQMKPILSWLESHPEAGLMHSQFALIGTSPAYVQYWRSVDDLLAFARDAIAPHLESWKHYSRVVSPGAGFGVWHEVYRVHAGDYEAIYMNMPELGLAAATEHVPITGATSSAAQRMAAGGRQSVRAGGPSPVSRTSSSRTSKPK